MSNDFFLEIGTEELPSGAVKPLAEALTTNLINAFSKADLRHGATRYFATPRRLAVLIQDLQQKQEAQQVTRRGPACAVSVDAQGKPLPALLGFAKSCGVTVEQLTKIQTEKGEWWVYESVNAGKNTADLLPSIVAEAVSTLPIAKPMRWGSGDAEFARPVHWVVLLLGDKLISTEVLGVKTGSKTYGHRFHYPQSLEVKKAQDYEAILNKGYVIADFNKRRQMIIQQIQDIAATHSLEAVMPESLLDEVTSIVEWPKALLVDFDPKFLEVPPEVLIASMQSHQKCFALRDQKGQLAPHFITIANIESKNPAQVVKGNEKVMRARLSDAAFFFYQDKKCLLSDYIEATSQVVFQAKLGSLKDKSQRMQALMAFLVKPLELEAEQASRAALLSKCDLLTGMVGEFPELQGLMGYYYALHDGEEKSLAKALNEQYMPRFAGDELPESYLGLALSLSDRLDILVGAFGIGQKPTGVKDPFKLRRHALAIVRMLVTIPAEIGLSTLLQATQSIYGSLLTSSTEIQAEVKEFILERLQSFYQNQGITADVVHAVRARQNDWLFDLDKRVHALVNFIRLPEANALSAACKRVNNLLQHVTLTHVGTVNSALFTEAAENALLERIETVESQMKSYYQQGDYTRILTELASLREVVDLFFEKVLIMVDDEKIKANRLNLLARLQSLLQGVADISLLTPVS